MPLIHLTTFIAAPIQRVFDLSRSISLHKHSMLTYNESIVGGKLKGLVNEGEEVVWTARHLYKTRKLRMRITAMHAATSFTDEQVEGDFRLMKHEHVFKPCDNGTIMIDLFKFETPYGIFGKMFNQIYLTGYMKALLEERNKTLKKVAEGNNWNVFLNS